jgi:small GTP-binding protein
MAADAIDLKVVALGAASVGKTSIIHRYCNRIFHADQVSTIGAGFFTHTMMMDNCEVTLLLWDTAGEERFRSVAPSLLRGANGLILVYDVAQPSSFNDLNIYLDMFLDTVRVDVSCELPVLVLGNKCDIEERNVSDVQVETWCSKNRIIHSYLVSAKTGEGIDEAINALVKVLLNPVQTTEKLPLQLTPIPASKIDGCC